MTLPDADPIQLLTLGETLKGNADDIANQIVTRWQEIARVEPWLALPSDLDFDHLPTLIRQLAAAALCTEFDRGLCEQVARTAAEHGEYRAAEGFHDDLIYREYHLLGRAMWERMREDHGESAMAYLAAMRLDALTGLGTAAALYGLHRDRVTGTRSWAEVLEDLLDKWPLPSSGR